MPLLHRHQRWFKKIKRRVANDLVSAKRPADLVAGEASALLSFSDVLWHSESRRKINTGYGDDFLRLRELKKEHTKSQLLVAALELIGRKGFEQTTLNEIAAIVQVSPRTLLRYFPTKEDLIVSWVDEGMSILRDGVKVRLQTDCDFDALLLAARDMLIVYEGRKDFYLVIERVIAASPQVSARKQQMIESLTRDVSGMLAERRKPDARARLISDVYTGTAFAMIRAAIRAWVATNGTKSLVGIFDEASTSVRFVEPRRPASPRR